MLEHKDAGEIIRTEPVETPTNGAADDPWREWNAWAQGHVNVLREEMIEEVTAALGTIRRQWRDEFEAQGKRIKELELKLAEAVGAINVLRGDGASGSLNVLRQEMSDSVGDALGMVRADFEDKLAVQAKRISELDLKLAEAVGALDVLRGKGAPGSLNVRGTFDPDKVYNYLDVVAFNGASWVATRDGPGALPGPGWQLLSSVGKRGPRGERGPRGYGAPVWTGISFDPKRLSFTPRLSDGSLGPEISLACILADVGVDPATYSIVFKMNDGSELKFSLYELFAQYDHEKRGR